MADEAIPVEATNNPYNIRTYTVANPIAVVKGTLMALVADNTASYSAASNTLFAGIAIADKTASDGLTQIGCDTGGVWDLTASGGITRGHKVVMAGGNRVGDSAWTIASSGSLAGASGALIVGTAIETATNGEIIRVDLNRR